MNGTLTTGEPKVIKSTVPKSLLQSLAAIESTSNNPIAKSINQFISEQKFEKRDLKECKPDTSHHSGISADVGDGLLMVGNQEFMDFNDIKTDEYTEEIKRENAEHVVYVAKNRRIVGYILLEDPLRDDAIPTIQELRNQGKSIYICTGADDITAKKYADQLGISHNNVRSGCVGESKEEGANTKTAYINWLKSQNRKVAMIGDAGNDSTAVVTSHFGVAVTSAAGHKATQANADAIINNNSLWSVVNTFTIAKQTVANVKQNLMISVGYNLLSVIAFSGLLVAIGFAINPAIGAALMVLQTVFILMNLEKFKRQSLSRIENTIIPSPKPSTTPWQSTDRRMLDQKNPLQKVLSPTPHQQVQSQTVSLSTVSLVASSKTLTVEKNTKKQEQLKSLSIV